MRAFMFPPPHFRLVFEGFWASFGGIPTLYDIGEQLQQSAVPGVITNVEFWAVISNVRNVLIVSGWCSWICLVRWAWEWFPGTVTDEPQPIPELHLPTPETKTCIWPQTVCWVNDFYKTGQAAQASFISSKQQMNQAVLRPFIYYLDSDSGHQSFLQQIYIKPLFLPFGRLM